MIFRIILIGVLYFITSSVHSQVKKITYEISAKNMSVKAVNSYPQELISLQRNDSAYCAVISTFAAYDDLKMREIVLNDKYVKGRLYPDSISLYLQSTPLTDCCTPKIRHVTDSILSCGDSLSIKVISRFLKYTSKSIKYDKELAMDLDRGRCTTLDVETIFERGKGTCSEYTNIFISLMRAAGIPCRMVVGYIYMPENNFQGAHAWAECYIKDYGWLAVDPQNGFYWYPSSAIKLFYGRDFIDCNIKTLPDMYPVSVKILE